jgi:hypothetical protein
VLPAQVRAIAHGVVLSAISSKAIAYTPVGIARDSIPYWIFTVVWVIVWCAVLAIVRRPSNRHGPSTTNWEKQPPGHVWWPSDFPASGTTQSRPTQDHTRPSSLEFGASLPSAFGKLPEPSSISDLIRPSAAPSGRPAAAVAGTARRPRDRARGGEKPTVEDRQRSIEVEPAGIRNRS